MATSIAKRLAQGALLLPLLLVVILGCSPRWDRGSGAHPPPSGPPVVAHRTSIPWLPPGVARHARLIDEASVRHGVDANLIAVVILVESGGDPEARSPAGAVGLMQLMPSTAADIARERGLAHDEGRLTDPAYNIDLGTFYLAHQVRRFWTGYAEATVAYAAGAYNGGPGRMRRHLDRGEGLPSETRRYQRWVAGMWRERFMPRSETFAAWYAAGGEHLVARSAAPASLAGR